MSFVENILEYQKRYRVASHILFWLAVMFLDIASSRYYDKSQFTYGFALIANGLYMIPQIISAYFLTYVIVPGFFFKKRYVGTAILFVAGSYLICIFCRLLVVRVAEPLAGIAPNAVETNREILTDLPKLWYVYFFHIFSLAIVFLFIKLLKDQLVIQKRTLTLEKEKAETELKLLKTQLHPHFLFNTLNNIYALSLTNSPVTSSSIGKLGEILDHILYRCDSLTVPLAGEVHLLNNYIALEQLRYDDRLQVHFKSRIDREIAIPPLILLSLVENAFKHGASDDTGNPVIDIDLEVREGVFRYSVSNSFVPKPVMDTRGNIGLPNLKKQLELIYPGCHTLKIGTDKCIYKVDLVIYLN